MELIFLGSSVKFLSVKCTQTIKNAIMSADNFSFYFEFSPAFKNEFKSPDVLSFFLLLRRIIKFPTFCQFFMILRRSSKMTLRRLDVLSIFLTFGRY
jgi:hypothetical protein